ncbi:hypothetical protein RDE2_51050 (plasmid) [Rhodococcus sp. RDE2]|nr:hypothetical protein RDE2_51050 [Rhodococcus sp. RDE2]
MWARIDVDGRCDWPVSLSPDPLGVDADTLANAFSTLMKKAIYLNKKEERRQGRRSLRSIGSAHTHPPRGRGA